MSLPIGTDDLLLALGLGLGRSALPRGFDATTGILVFLALIAGYLVYEFIRDAKARSSVAIIGAVLGHVLLVVFLSLDIPARLGWGVEEIEPDLIEFEVAEIEPEPEPEPPKQPEEPEPEPEPEKPPEKVKPKQPPPKKTKKVEQPTPDEPVEPEQAPAKRWDLSKSPPGNSPVIVQQGRGGEYGGQGKADSKGTKKGPAGGGDPRGDEDGTEAKWQPRSELFIKNLPRAIKVPKIECPASAQLGVEGDVILKVQITSEGKVRQVKVIKGIGQGCDKVAVKALKQARFKAAIGTNGEPVDFELRWEYAFTLNR